MNQASAYPELEALPALVHQQRRLTAGQLRITREEKALRDRMRTMLDQAGVSEVACNGYLVHAARGRDGRSTVKVTPLTRDA